MAQTFVSRTGNANAVVAGTTLVVTVGAAGVTQGNKLIVAFGSNDPGTGNSPTCADSKGNTYVLELEDNMQTNGNKRLGIFSATMTAALVLNDTITVTCPSLTRRVMDILEFTNVGIRDRSKSLTFSVSSTPSTGATATRRSANQVLIGVCLWIFSSAGDTITAGVNYLGAATVGADTGATNLELGTIYQIVTAIGTDNANGTLPGNRGWIMAILTMGEAGVTFVAPAGWASTPQAQPPFTGMSRVRGDTWVLPGDIQDPTFENDTWGST